MVVSLRMREHGGYRAPSERSRPARPAGGARLLNGGFSSANDLFVKRREKVDGFSPLQEVHMALKPGNRAPASGQDERIGPRGAAPDTKLPWSGASRCRPRRIRARPTGSSTGRETTAVGASRLEFGGDAPPPILCEHGVCPWFHTGDCVTASSSQIYFSDAFEVSPQALEDYGALDVSLINDLPLFIDPFLLFNSPDVTYRELHDKMIGYLRFLRDKAIEGNLSDGLLEGWFTFREVKQNWLGYSLSGNNGSGLGMDFATALCGNLATLFHSFGAETVTHGSHLEKLCLIADGVGRDNIKCTSRQTSSRAS